MFDRNTAVRIMNKVRAPKTTFEKVYGKIQKAILQASKSGCGYTYVETGGLDSNVRKEITKALANLGYRVKWHDINDYDDERIKIVWEFV